MRVFVAGHRGTVGSAVCRLLQKQPGIEVLTGRRADYTSAEDTRGVLQYHVDYDDGDQPIDALVMAAARVGGIQDNQRYARHFLETNLAIQKNLFEVASVFEIERVIFLGSTCVYPRDALTPILEEQLLTGPFEPTNQPYAIAKLVGIEQVRLARKSFPLWTTLMPSNLYGPGDNFSIEGGHALPSLMYRLQQKIAELRTTDIAPFPVWGLPSTVREWTHVDDIARAILTVLRAPNIANHVYNVGSGYAVDMTTLVELLQEVAGTNYAVDFNGKNIGAQARMLNCERFKTEFGWTSQISLRDGVNSTWDWLCEQDDVRC